MPSDVFRPRLPLDPFANLQHSVPWRIPADLAPSPPQVIFALGEPLLPDLLPLLHSPHLAQSLLLIATHVPLALPTTAAGQGPALRILRLAAPLHVHDTGALRLVSLFERAQRVAALWRSSSTTPHILYLAEDGPNGEFTLVDAPEKKYPSPAPSIASVKRARSIKNRLSMLSESLQAAGSVVSLTSSPSPKKARRSLITFGKDPAGNTTSSPSRSFDAIVNFLPSGLPEKALFKQSILVTTLSAQYLVLPYTHASGSAPGSDPRAYHYQRRSSSPPTPLALPSFSSSASASSSSSLFSSLAAPPKAQTSITQRHHRRFSSFALTSYPDARNSACSSPTPSSRASGDESPALSSESRAGSSYGLFSSAVTTPATTPGGELSADEAFCQEDDDIRALKMLRRKSLTKRLSTLFASVSRPVSISSAADLAAADMEMGVLGASARPSRPQNAHIVHVLPADWTPAPTPPPSSVNLSSPYAKARAPPSHTKPKLVQGIEQFLLSFAYPLAGLSDVSSQSSSRNHARRSGVPPSAYRQGFNSYNQRPESWGSVARAGAGGGQLSSLLDEESSKARAVPYLVAPGMFGRTLGDRKGKGRARQSQWLTAEKLYEEAVEEYDEEEEEEDGEGTVEDGSEEIQPRVRVRRRRNVTLGEVVLLGALDLDAGADPEDMSGNRAAVGCGRAWIAEGDVELVGVAAGDVVEVPRSTTVRRKEKGKEVQVSKEDSTASLGLPTPPRSQRSSTSSTSADSAECSASGELTRSNSTGSCSEGAQSKSKSADASQVDVQTQASTATTTTTTTTTTTSEHTAAEAAVTMTGASARASVIAVPPRAAPRRESSESAASASCLGSAFASGSASGVTSGSGSGSASVVLGGVPMSRSPTTGSGKAPHYVPATLVAKQQEEGAKEVVDAGDSVKVPPAVHLLGGGSGGSGSGQSTSANAITSTSTPPSASTTATRPAESSDIPVVDGAPTGSVGTGTGTGTSAASATDAAAGTQKSTYAGSKLGLNLHLRTSMRLRAPALLREQTKVKAKARPASMIVLGGQSQTQLAIAQNGEKRAGGYGVLPAVGSALRRVQGFGNGVLASGIALGRSASLKVKREEKAKEGV